MYPTPLHRLLGGFHQHFYFPIFSLFFCLAACAEHLDAKRTKSPGKAGQRKHAFRGCVKTKKSSTEFVIPSEVPACRDAVEGSHCAGD